MSKYLLLSSFISHIAFASFEIYLKQANQIPIYAQETNVWCGAASAQMMLEGFPDGVDHVYKQKYIWDTIQPLKVETSWYTDPDGLKAVMGVLGGDSNWEVRCSKTTTPMLRSLVRNLADRKFPATVLVYGDAHWIVFIGATTDVDPGTATSITLEKVEAFDPWHAQHVLVSGSTWFQKYWKEPARSRGKWNGCYVAVQENTNTSRNETPMEIKVASSIRSGIPLTSEEALAMGSHHLKRLISENQSFSKLSRQTMFAPRLVTHDQGAYFLISLGDERNQTTQGGIMLNAYTGDWEGLSQHKELPYLEVKSSAGDWVFSPSQESPSPFFPAYRILTKDGESYVDHAGRTSTSLHPLIPGS